MVPGSAPLSSVNAATATQADRRRRQVLLSRWLLGAAVVALVAVIAYAAVTDRASPGEADFVARVRDVHPELSPARAPDERLIDVARSTCRPEGMSSVDRRWLNQIGVEVEWFTDASQVLCPSR